MITTGKNIYQYLLATDGVNQSQRSQPALDPAKIKLDERTRADLVRFVYDISKQIRYYDSNKFPQGTWQSFFEVFRNGTELMTEAELNSFLTGKKDLSPHLALLLAFFQIYSFAQQDLNTLTKKRLDYYYQDVLQLKRKKADPDQVHVLFELSKNAEPLLLEAGELLDAGKTSSGIRLQYALENDLVISHSKVASIRSSFTDFTPTGKGIVFKSNDATTLLNDTGTAWRPFGASQLILPQQSRLMEPAFFGWAISSPNLLLAEGRRRVTLNIHLKSFKGTTFPELAIASMLDVAFTGEKDWVKEDIIIEEARLIPGIAIEDQDPAKENPFTINMTVVVNESLPAITAYNEAIHQGSYTAKWPVMQVLLRPESYMLETFSRFKVDSVFIEVEAKDVKNLILQNDQAVQPTDGPILPFTSSPLVQSNFYIGSQEIFSKTVTSLNIKLEWQDPPEDLADYYSGYGNENLTQQHFKIAVDLLTKRNWNNRIVPNHPLFNSIDATQVNEVPASKGDIDLFTENSPFTRDVELELPSSFNNSLQQGFIRIVLKEPTKSTAGYQPLEAPFEALGHKTFPSAYTKQVIALSKFVEGSGTAPELPNPPYTPILKSVSLDYTASDVFRPDTPNGIEQYFIQDVFGPGETIKDDVVALVPSQPGNGALYIGLEKAGAPQSISLLFQIEEGSVESDELLNSTDLHWSFLAGNHWEDISASDIIEESTDGFQKPGITRVNIGMNASQQHSLMPASMRWLRVSVDDNTGGAAAIQTILAQAARAKLLMTETDPSLYEEHLSKPLAAETISKLVVKKASIKKITQPYSSFGGKNPESDDSFYRRVSERLRHKNRAVSGWDYERLLLEAFPEIYKIKCLPHSDNKEEWLKPGDVRLVVVPDWRKSPSGDPLQPKANQHTLREIAEFIANNYTSPFVKVHATNPRYETLLVDCEVSFRSGFDPGYYTTVLDDELKKFLSPWAYLEGKDIVFGGKVHASEILAFIEGREYVDFLVDFELYHRHEEFISGGIGDMQIGLDFIIGYSPEPSIATDIDTGGKTIGVDFIVGEPVEIAAATRPDTILVSNSRHRIESIQAGHASCQGIQTIGIGQMIIGLDFVPIS